MAGEALVELFSSLSHKRRHGNLRLTAAGVTYELAFFDGRIIDVSRPGANDAREICSRLVRAGLIQEKVFQLVQSKPLSVPQLFDLLVSKKFVSAVDFQRAKRAHDLDILHSLGYAEDAAHEFQARDLRPDPRFPLSISPSQLLLDFCELQFDEERFQATFGPHSAPICRSVDEPTGLCDFERAVWQIVNGTKRGVDLFRSILSEYEVKEGLLALFDRGFIGVRTQSAAEPAASQESAEPDMDDFALSQVDDRSDFLGKIAGDAVDSILEAFEDNISLDELADAVLEEPPPRQAASHLAAPVSREAAKSAAPVKTVVAPAPASPRAPVPSVLPTSAFEAGAATPADEIGQTVPESSPVAENISAGEPALQHLLVRFLRQSRERGMKTALFETNHLFLEKRALEKITLVTLLAYLISLSIFCALGIGMIEPWFNALSEFTSAASSFVVE